MDLTTFTKDIQERIKRFLPKEKELPVATSRICISLTTKEVSIVQIDRTTDEIELLVAQSVPFEDIHSLPLVLSGLVMRYNLGNSPVSWLLPIEDYQLFLIEAPPVPEKEFLLALNWRVRSLLSYPVEEAVIDYFPLPDKKAAPDNAMIGVTTTRLNQLAPIVDIIKKSGLSISVIDIPELALRNLSALYEDDEKSTAFIYFYEKIVILNITRQRTLYFTRRINRTATTTTSEAEQISLEIMRYFDFFQSKWRYPSPIRIFVASEASDTEILAKTLSEYLLTPVLPFTIKSVLASKEKLSQLETKYLLPFGAALREEKTYVSPKR